MFLNDFSIRLGYGAFLMIGAVSLMLAPTYPFLALVAGVSFLVALWFSMQDSYDSPLPYVAIVAFGATIVLAGVWWG